MSIVGNAILLGGGGGGDDALVAFIEEPTTGVFENSKITKIRNVAFYNCTSLTTVNFPTCTSIGGSAFGNCYSLTTMSFPACTSIGGLAFYNCYSLTAADFPVCTTMGTSAFYNCYNLTAVSFPACTRIGSNAFANCRSLTTVSFPNCTTIDSNAFAQCSRLTTVVLNTSRTASSIYSSAFSHCYNLTSLYLLASTMYKLNNRNVFTSTPISNYTTSTGGVYGSIFVRESLYVSYKGATNWTTYSSRFVGLTNAQVTVIENGEYISFYINGAYYVAEEGMTWSEWCESDYNAYGITIVNGKPTLNSGLYINVNQNETIIAEYFYNASDGTE